MVDPEPIVTEHAESSLVEAPTTGAGEHDKPARIEMVMLLRRIDLFTFCSAEEIVRIAEICHHQVFPEGAAIYRAGEPATLMHCVIEGAVRVGREGSWGEAAEGDSFGVREILSGKLRTGSAEAITATTTLAVEAEDFFDLLSNNAEIIKALFREVLEGDGGGLL